MSRASQGLLYSDVYSLSASRSTGGRDAVGSRCRVRARQSRSSQLSPLRKTHVYFLAVRKRCVPICFAPFAGVRKRQRVGSSRAGRGSCVTKVAPVAVPVSNYRQGCRQLLKIGHKFVAPPRCAASQLLTQRRTLYSLASFQRNTAIRTSLPSRRGQSCGPMPLPSTATSGVCCSSQWQIVVLSGY